MIIGVERRDLAAILQPLAGVLRELRADGLVTITPQDTRARLRVGRCFAGPVYVVATPIALASWPYQIGYEWAALAKALTVQRSC